MPFNNSLIFCIYLEALCGHPLRIAYGTALPLGYLYALPIKPYRSPLVQQPRGQLYQFYQVSIHTGFGMSILVSVIMPLAHYLTFFNQNFNPSYYQPKLLHHGRSFDFEDPMHTNIKNSQSINITKHIFSSINYIVIHKYNQFNRLIASACSK